MNYFSVANWQKFQHYDPEKRTPPWIKFYSSILDKYEYAQLPDASKAHLFAIWLLASRLQNRIPNDPAWIAKQISATTPVDLRVLASAGFIEGYEDASNTLASCKQNASPRALARDRDREEKESEKETDVDRPQKPRPRPKQALPADWTPDAEHRRIAAEEHRDVEREAQKFRDWAAAGGIKRADWPATFRNWLRSEFGRNGAKPATDRITRGREALKRSLDKHHEAHGHT